MATPPRVLIPNGLYHVYTCGTGPSPLFHEDADHEHFNFTLGVTVMRYDWKVVMWCHMTTHVHLLVRTPQPNLDAGMQRTKSCYARYHNRKYERRGALFDSRYGCRVITTRQQLLRTVRYIARNPEEAGLCKSAVDYRWSSLGRTLRLARPWPANGDAELIRACGSLDALRGLIERGEGLDDEDEGQHSIVTASEAV